MKKMKIVIYFLILLSIMSSLLLFTFFKSSTYNPTMSRIHSAPGSKKDLSTSYNGSVPALTISVLESTNISLPAFSNSVKVAHTVSVPDFYNSITDYTPRPDVNKYVIYLCDGSSSCGGWADRQKGIVSSFVLAQALGRKFRVQLTHPCELSAHLAPKTIDWRIKPDELKGLSKTYIKILDSKADKLRKEMVTMDLESKYPEDIIYFTSNMEYSHYLLQNTKYKKQTFWMTKFSLRQLYVYLLQQLFHFVPELEERFQNFTSAIVRNNNSRFFCAQVRLGKNPTVPTDSQTLNSLQSVGAVWAFLSQFTKVQKHQVFVTSDSEQVRENARKLFRANMLDTKGDIVHIEHPRKSKDVCGGFSKVLIDQRILSMCDLLVISRSGFAMIGAWFRNKTDDLYCFSKGQIKSCHPDKLGHFMTLW